MPERWHFYDLSTGNLVLISGSKYIVKLGSLAASALKIQGIEFSPKLWTRISPHPIFPRVRWVPLRCFCPLFLALTIFVDGVLFRCSFTIGSS
jgi:hypothetical protein